MENIKKILEWLKGFPLFVRIVLLLLVSALLFVFTLSCGTPKTVATVQNVNPNSTVTVTMSVSNSTTSTPSVDVDGVPISEPNKMSWFFIFSVMLPNGTRLRRKVKSVRSRSELSVATIEAYGLMKDVYYPRGCEMPDINLLESRYVRDDAHVFFV